MGEVDADGMPVGADPDLGRTEAIHDADRELGGLARGHGGVRDDLLANDHRLARLFDEDGQGIIEQVNVLHYDLQGLAQVGLIAQQQADLAKVRQLAMLRHAQTQALAVPGTGGQLEQVDYGGDGDALIGHIQNGGAEAGLRQQAGGIEAQLAGDIEIVGEGGGSGKEGHDAIPMATAHLLVACC